jgi:ABC-type nitrate/sulfonate/bicarbonate transport system permease component
VVNSVGEITKKRGAARAGMAYSRAAGQMIKKRGAARTAVLAYLPAVGLLILFFALWEGAVWIFHIATYFLPAPSAIIATVVTDRALFVDNLWITVEEVLVGFAVALGIAMVLGMGISFVPFLRKAFYPLIVASQTVPIISIAPILLVWFGYGVMPKVIIVALVTFFPLTINTVLGFDSVDRELVRLFKSMKATSWQIFRLLRVPFALPFILSGVKIGVTLSVIGAAIGEWVGSVKGIGYIILVSGQQMKAARVFAGIGVLSAIGIILFLVVVVIERRLIPWYFAQSRE